ncbi:hypothetical protein CONLIGDRAFT_579539 [Coniochaeta ligniaria NRRL 30616]|uniref:Uncharacterized protein n=1 Tax=Coniochaeta ligniaria NRRL 30616 TaxID=1408157 RepID=A0A1J7IJ49_9PEZI|nr:hypothetical protein CONLIGDRAFT_579539 [Coniochaeta ligniaria NRRL 30616]
MVGDGYVLGPRVPLLRNRDAMDVPSPVLGARVPSRVMPRATDTTSADPCDGKSASSQFCEKPASSSGATLPIALGVAIPLVAIISVLLYLHFRVNRKLRNEDAQDPHKSLDFGLDVTKGAKANRKSMLGGYEKDNHTRHRQMSMDLNLSSPYLLPPALHDSRESLHSLARTIHQNEDPYRPINQLMGDGGSIRSPSRGPDGASIYSHESNRQQRRSLLGPGGAFNGPPRQNLIPKDASYRKPPPVLPPISTASPAPSARDPFRSPSERSIETSPYPDEKDGLVMPTASEIQEPAPAAYRLSDKSSPLPQSHEPVNELPGSVVQHNRQDGRIRSQQAVIHERGPSAIELDAIQARSPPPQPSALPLSPPAAKSLPAVPQVAAPILEEPLDYYDDYAHMPQGNHEHPVNDGYEEDRGRTHQRESSYYEPQQHQVGLGIPQQDNHRLSVGFRPLPPDELMDTEDPETRANRIRSFYKEYFDDSKDGATRQPQMVPPVPQLHQQQYQQHGNYPQGGTEYYEDYDQHYAGGDDPYYDPNANAFVMPYAQPVARRAMTPPPSGSRFQGQRAPPRGYHGSMGDMNMGMPGMRGPPRPGSSASRQYGSPRPGTSQSGAWGRPRAGSSLSAYGPGRNGPPKKALPPPVALSTLPTPSKLKDDSFAIFNAADFAPPETYKDRVAGRSQSPMGERRPYAPGVPVHSPLINAFEEMPSLPSPHLLRKSNTFTGLDFAPPRKFVESDNRSETGSIRSNRSGISAVQLGAIRSGAGRVSKLPGDTIFTQAAMEQKLKPSWTMRD